MPSRKKPSKDQLLKLQTAADLFRPELIADLKAQEAVLEEVKFSLAKAPKSALAVEPAITPETEQGPDHIDRRGKTPQETQAAFEEEITRMSKIRAEAENKTPHRPT